MAAVGKCRAFCRGGPDLESCLRVAVRMDRGSLNLTPTATIKLRHYPIGLPKVKLGWPAMSIAVESIVRFPWAGGRHPFT